MTDPVEHLARTVAEPGPCGCWTHHQPITPFHRGHCCFWPASNTCHPEFVEQWERDRDRRRKYDDEARKALEGER